MPSASEAHLRTLLNDSRLPFDTLVARYLDSKPFGLEITGPMRGQIKAVLDMESRNRDKIISYHGLPFRIAVVMDILSTLRSVLSQQKSFSYRWDSAFSEIERVEDYFNTIYSNGGWEKHKDQVICANLALFGNHDVSSESTFEYWIANRGAGTFPFEDIFGPVLQEMGLPGGLYQDYEAFVAWAEKILNPSGRLLQIFINPPDADQTGFVYWILKGGTSHPKMAMPLDRPSPNDAISPCQTSALMPLHKHMTVIL